MTTADRLKAAKLRVTAPRIEILELLESACHPITHVDLLAKAPELDRVTLYRVLDALVGADLVHKVQGTDGAWRFCAHQQNTAGCPGGHPHILCERCGAMACLTEQTLPHVETPAGFRVTHKQLVIMGICESCQKTQKTSDDSEACSTK